MARGRGYSRRTGGRAKSGGKSPNSSTATGNKGKRASKKFEAQRGTKQFWK